MQPAAASPETLPPNLRLLVYTTLTQEEALRLTGCVNAGDVRFGGESFPPGTLLCRGMSGYLVGACDPPLVRCCAELAHRAEGWDSADGAEYPGGDLAVLFAPDQFRPLARN